MNFQRKIRMCFPAPTVRSLPLALFTRGRSASAVLQLIGPKEFLLQLGSVFRDELLRVRLFNFAGEILIKKKNPPTGSVQRRMF